MHTHKVYVPKYKYTRTYIHIQIFFHSSIVFVSDYILIYSCIEYIMGARGGVVVEALRYKPAGRGFDSRWCHDMI